MQKFKHMLLNFSIKKSFDTIILAILMLFPLLPIKKLPILLYLLIIYIVVSKRNTLKINIKQISLRPILIISGWYLISLFAFFYTDNTPAYFKISIRNIPFIAIPFLIIYGFKDINLKQLNTLFKTLILFALVQIIILYFGITRGANYFLNENIPYFNFFENIKRFFVHTPNELLGFFKWQPNRSFLFFHKAYFSILNLTCIVFLFKKTTEPSSLKKKILIILLIGVFLGSIFFVFSMPNIILLPIIFTIMFFKNIKKHRKPIYIASIGMFLICFTYSQSPGAKRYMNIQHKKTSTFLNSITELWNNPSSVAINNGRIRSFTCALDLIKKNALFGIGEGDTKKLLLNCYKEKGFLTQYKEEHNTHNYYLNLLISGGLVQLFLFLLMFAYALRIAYNKQNLLLACFMIIILFNLLFENLFSRVYGIFLFTIIFSLLIKTSYSKKTA